MSLDRDVRFRPFPVTPREEGCLETKGVLLFRARGIPPLSITVHGHGSYSGCCETLVTNVIFIVTAILIHVVGIVMVLLSTFHR